MAGSPSGPWVRILAAALLVLLLGAGQAHAQWGASQGTVAATSSRVVTIVQAEGAPSFVNATWGATSVHTANPTAPGSGWGVCYGAMVCMCPAGASTCPSTAPPATDDSYAGPSLFETYHSVGSLNVWHRWLPAGGSGIFADMVRADVYMWSNGTVPLQDLIYRRGEAFLWNQGTMPVDAARMSVGSSQPAYVANFLRGSTNYGMANPMPGAPFGAGPYGGPATCPYTAGPGSITAGPYFADVAGSTASSCTTGGLVEIGLGTLNPGGNHSFSMFYGVAPDEAQALNRVGPSGLDADFWFLVQHSTAPLASSGAPLTYFWAFTGLNATVNGGGGPVPPPTPPVPPPPPPPPAPPPPCNCTPPPPPPPPCNCTPPTPPPPPPCCSPPPAPQPPPCTNNCTSSAPPPGPQSAPGQSPGAGQAPVAGFVVIPSSPAPGQSARLRDQSHDADGAIVAWLWEFGDGHRATGREAQHAFKEAGTYRVRLTVFDDAGRWATRTIDVVVAPAEAAPVPAPAEAPAPPSQERLASGGVSSLDGCSDGVVCGGPRPGLQPAPAAPASMALVQPANSLPWLLLALTAVAAAATLAWGQRRRWLPFAAVLFSRMQRSELLDHPTRAAIVELVQASPGIRYAELRSRLEAARGNLDHHLQILLRAGLVQEQRTPAHRFLFPPGAQADAAAQAALASGRARRILDAVRERPGRTVADLARAMGSSYRAASYHVGRLASAGLVEVADGDSGPQVYPKAEAMQDAAPAAGPLAASA